MTSLYHRLPRDHPRFAHWRLPVSGIIAVAGYLAASVVLIGVVIAGFEIAGEGDRIDEWMDTLELSGLDDPIFLGVDLGGIAILLPVVLLALLATGRHQAGLLLSVEGRMRWRWLALTSVLAFAVVAGVFLASVLVLPVDVVGARPDVRLPDGTMVVGLVVVLLLVPFQAAAEEVVCRGYLLQLIGSWIPKVWLGAIVGGVVGTALFVLGHAYELWGQVDVGLFGVVCVVLTLRTGGLEAAIALHAANNIVLFAFDGFAVWPDVTSGDADGPLYVLPTVVIALIFIGLVELAAARGGLARRREWPVLPPPRPRPAWGPGWGPAPYPHLAPARVSAPPQVPATVGAPPAGSLRPEVSPEAPPYPGELPEGWNR